MEKNNLDRPQGMMRTELDVLKELLISSKAKAVLEVGMANGSSTEVILSVLATNGGHLTSVDPFQLVPPPEGFGGEGVRRVEGMGLSHLHTLMPKMNYLALPELVDAKRQFDFVFIDGYHSLDYAMLDFVFADLLLITGGMLVLHDSSSKAVYKVCQFIEHNRPYRSVGPPPQMFYDSVFRKGARRLYQNLSSRRLAFKERRDRWKSLAVFVKESSELAPQFDVKGL